jgi:hypothetical protein
VDKGVAKIKVIGPRKEEKQKILVKALRGKTVLKTR